MQDKKSRKMLRVRGLIWAMLVGMIVFSALTTVAWAVPEIRSIDTQNVTKFEEPAALGAERESKAPEGEKAQKKKAISEGEADLPGAAGAEEFKPWWMFPGWQTFFAALAVGYYALMLTFLPKVMAKEEGHH